MPITIELTGLGLAHLLPARSRHTREANCNNSVGGITSARFRLIWLSLLSATISTAPTVPWLRGFICRSRAHDQRIVSCARICGLAQTVMNKLQSRLCNLWCAVSRSHIFTSCATSYCALNICYLKKIVITDRAVFLDSPKQRAKYSYALRNHGDPSPRTI